MYIPFVMKDIKQLILCALLVTLSLGAHAEVLFVENFDYTSGSTLMAANSEWFHQWEGHENSMLITDEGLTFDGYAGSGIGKALLIEGDHSNDEPHHVFKKVTSGDVWVALLLKPTYVVKRGYLLTLRDDKIDKNTFNQCGRIFLDWDYFGEEPNEEIHPIIGARVYKTADEVYAEDVPLDESKTYLVVLRYCIVPDANNEVSLYLFDKMPKVLPEKPLVGPLTDPKAPDIEPAHVVLHTWNASLGEAGEVTIDGLRIATTFHEALGISDTPDPEPDPEGISNVAAQQPAFSLQLRNGQLVLTNGEKTYNLLGTKIE